MTGLDLFGLGILSYVVGGLVMVLAMCRWGGMSVLDQGDLMVKWLIWPLLPLIWLLVQWERKTLDRV
ncbi:hypothetical protein KIKIMORA_01160 [Brevundimonas phage vB_BpoS-Kikimora]|uniref:Uncharacterized protein n=1 Tax=Brevundimonas phage vB_BpoS-Kikimora TaxID=2948601 RepID=A0A9E7MT19_9CAUD|nr:hypothetical protein KIKIMORA_01160 [Brevundimonas phage vB_BpoS-Kikimora]